MLAAYTERCTSSLSYLLVRFTPPPPPPPLLQRQQPHWFRRTRARMRSQTLRLNRNYRWISRVQSKGFTRALWCSSQSNRNWMFSGFIIQAWAPKKTNKKTREIQSKRSADSEFLCRCCVRCCKEAIRGNELAFPKIPERSELIIAKPFFILTTSTPL